MQSRHCWMVIRIYTTIDFCQGIQKRTWAIIQLATAAQPLLLLLLLLHTAALITATTLYYTVYTVAIHLLNIYSWNKMGIRHLAGMEGHYWLYTIPSEKQRSPFSAMSSREHQKSLYELCAPHAIINVDSHLPSPSPHNPYVLTLVIVIGLIPIQLALAFGNARRKT